MRLKLRKGEDWQDDRFDSAGICACGGGGDNGAAAAAAQNAQLARENFVDYMAYVKAKDAEYKPTIDEMIGLQKQVSTENINRARLANDTFTNTGLPILADLNQQASIDPATAGETAAGQAAAGVQQQADIQADIGKRRMAAYGISPDEGAARGADRAIQVQIAASRAGAANQARTATKAKNWAQKLDVYGAATGQQGLSTGAYGLASQAAGSGVSGANQTIGTGANAMAGGSGFLSAANQATGIQMQGNQQQDDGTMGALGTIAGAAITKIPWSDRRLKENIRHVGTGPHDLPLYEFSYLGRDEVYRGVMADEVEKVMPEAVITHSDGYQSVNYAMLGIDMARVR